MAIFKESRGSASLPALFDSPALLYDPEFRRIFSSTMYCDKALYMELLQSGEGVFLQNENAPPLSDEQIISHMAERKFSPEQIGTTLRARDSYSSTGVNKPYPGCTAS